MAQVATTTDAIHECSKMWKFGMNISFSRILPVYDCIHNADISELVSPQCGVESKRPRKLERDVPCTKVQLYLLRILFGSCTKDIHYRWRAPEVAAFLNCKYLLPNMRSLMPPTPQPLKFVPIKNLKTGVVHLAAFIANLPRRIRDNWKWFT